MSEDDYVYCTSEDGNFTDYCSVMDDLTDRYEVGEKVKIYKGQRDDYKHSDFVTDRCILYLIDPIQEIAFDEVQEFAEDYLSDLDREKRDDLKRIICEWLDKNAKIDICRVVKVEQIEVTVE